MDQEFFEDTMKMMFQIEPMAVRDWATLGYASLAMIGAFLIAALFFL